MIIIIRHTDAEVLQELAAILWPSADPERQWNSDTVQEVADTLALLIDRNLLEYDDGDESLALHQTIADVARTSTPTDAVTRHREHYLARVNAD